MSKAKSQAISRAILKAIREYEVEDPEGLTEKELLWVRCFDGLHNQILLGKVRFALSSGIFMRAFPESIGSVGLAPVDLNGGEYGGLQRRERDIVAAGISKLLAGPELNAFFTVEEDEYYVDMWRDSITICMKDER